MVLEPNFCMMSLDLLYTMSLFSGTYPGPVTREQTSSHGVSTFLRTYPDRPQLTMLPVDLCFL